MKQIHRLVLKSYIGPLFVTFFISLFFLLMQFLWKWVDDFVGKGLEWSIIGNILFYASSNLVPLALPLGILLASIMTFGNMGEQYELTAMKASGISLMKTMKPLIVLTVLMSFGAFFFSNNVLPYTNLKLAKLLYDVSRKRPELNIKTGIFNNDIEGYSIKIDSKNQETGMMYDFMIYNHLHRKGNPEVILADSGKLSVSADEKYMKVVLYSGRSYNEMEEKTKPKSKKEYPHRRDKFSKQILMLALTGFEMKESDVSIFKKNYQMMTIKQLRYVIDSLSEHFIIRKDEAVSRLLRYNYSKYESKGYLHLKPKIPDNRPVISIEDTVKKIKPATKSPKTKISTKQLPSINIDSIYANLSDAKKAQVLEITLGNVNKTKQSIESNAIAIFDRAKWIKKHELAWYRKFSMSFACLIFFFIGAPLGAIIRKGGFGLPILVSILFFMVYYVLTMTGEKFARDGIIPVFAGAWLSSFVLFPIGVFITYQAVRDSNLLNTEAIRKALLKIIKSFDKSKFTKSK